jgi:RND family efflux transporter MFP subunit
MRVLRNRWFIAGTVAFLLVAPAAWLIAGDAETEDNSVIARVKKGEFKVVVTTSGELRPTKFVRITAPPNAQAAQQWQMKISSLVPEGTMVKEGQVVAELDRANIAGRLTEVTTSLQKAQAQYEQAELDSTLNLSKAREEIRTMELGLEEKRLAKEQAVYEAPTVKRQAEIEYEKAERALAQAKKDYVTKTEQAKAKMREVGAERDRFANQVRIVQEVMAGFTIKAPASGMVIYEKEWNGKKRTVGSQIGAWEPTVATLPDLTRMESMTYVNEIDIRKIAVGQPVDITLDSDPTKKFAGKVTSVANVGEQRPNSDAKVFEVKVELTESDTTLRPGMTTSNSIETLKLDDVMYVPLEAISSDSGVTVVFKHDGGRVVRQEILTGAMSDDEAVVAAGLEENDRVLLVPPADRESIELVRLPGSVSRPTSPPAGDSAKGLPLQSGSADSTAPDTAQHGAQQSKAVAATKAPARKAP